MNWMIKHIPMEMHIPGYQYCGPGTKLKERLANNDPGINDLDRACKEHDIAYSRVKDVSGRNQADIILGKKAFQRARATDASISERAAALTIAGIMSAKSRMGMGLGSKIAPYFNHRYIKGGSNSSSRCSKSSTKSGKTKMGGGGGKVKNQTKNKKKKQKQINVQTIFRTAKAKAKDAIKNKRARTVSTAAKVAETAAVSAVKKLMKKQPLIPASEVESGLRVIPVPKQGSALPLIPIFAGLSALGALLGGSASIANAAVSASNAKKDFAEAQRHNQTMEAISLGDGKNTSTGSGLYLRPYKKGFGLYLTPNPPTNLQKNF